MSKRHSEQFKQEAVAYALSNKDKPVKAMAPRHWALATQR